MEALRRHILRHHHLAAWLVGAALLLKLLVPAGFMPGVSSSMMVVQLCTGQGAQTMMIEIPGQTGEHNQKKSDMPCAFSGLSSPSLAGTDSILLAIALAFILVAAFRVAPSRRPVSSCAFS